LVRVRGHLAIHLCDNSSQQSLLVTEAIN